MGEKTIYLVTHGPKIERDGNGCLISDPRMTPRGKWMIGALISELRKRLPGGEPSEIHVGTGLRQWEVTFALGFHKLGEVFFSALWGDASSGVSAGGKGPITQVVLGHGLVINLDHYLTIQHLQRIIAVIIRELPDNAVICSGRPVLVRLGVLRPEECESGALYALHVHDDGNITAELIVSGDQLLDGGGAKV